MKEIKEMMIRLPMVTATSWEELNKARTYPQSGRYIVKMDDGDIAVADVALRPVGQGEERAIDEETQAVSYCFVGLPEILDPDEWVLATDLENARLAYEADRKQMEKQMREANDCHEAEMADQKAKFEAAFREKEERCNTFLKEKEAELQRRMDALDGESAKNYQLRKMELEHEYEKKWMQLELDTPKRFAQGEWVSGKTLTEIIRALTAGKKED